jgi:hypothetical protein
MHKDLRRALNCHRAKAERHLEANRTFCEVDGLDNKLRGHGSSERPGTSYRSRDTSDWKAIEREIRNLRARWASRRHGLRPGSDAVQFDLPADRWRCPQAISASRFALAQIR